MKTIWNPRYRAVIRWLVAARKAAGLSQAKAAQRSGMPRVTITKIERCDRRIDILELMALVKVYDIDVKEIVAIFNEGRGG